MPALDFPPSPIVGTVYVGANGITYIYDGIKWNGQITAVPGPQGPQGPQGPIGPTGPIATATVNILGGGPGSIPIQLTSSTTAFIPLGATGTVLISNGSTATWVSTTTIYDPSSTVITINTVTDANSQTQYLALADSFGPFNNLGANSNLNYVPDTGTLTTPKLYVSSTLTSNSTDSGAVIIEGGVGIGGRVWTGDRMLVHHNEPTNTLSVIIPALEVWNAGSRTSAISMRAGPYLDDDRVFFYNNSGTFVLDVTNQGFSRSILYGSLNNVNISVPTTATSTNTGALTVWGGVGIGGDLWVNEDINFKGNLYKDGVLFNTTPGGSNGDFQINNNGSFGGATGITFNTSTQNLIIRRELFFGDFTNDNYSRLKHIETMTLNTLTSVYSSYGFTTAFEQATVIVNEDNTLNQVIFLGDSGPTGQETLFGIGILDNTAGPFTLPTTGTETGWIKKLELVASGDLKLPEGGLETVFDVKPRAIRLNTTTNDISTGNHGIYFADGTYQYTASSGIAGPSGPQGPTGPTGPQGPQGPGADQALNTTSTVTFASITTPLISVRNVNETFVNISNASGVVAHDYSQAAIFNHTAIQGTFTVNVTNLTMPAGYSTNLVLILNQTSTAYVPNVFQIGGVTRAINWQAGAQPIGNPNRKDVVSFSLINNAGTQVVFGQLVSFG